MNGGITIEVPCQRHVAHYLRREFGQQPTLGHDSMEGKYFLSLLERKSKRREDYPVKYDDVLTVNIQLIDMACYGHELTLTANKRFNDFVDAHLKKHLFTVYMKALVHRGGFQIAHSIRLFQEEYDFPESVWAFETLKKYYDRNINPKNNLKVA